MSKIRKTVSQQVRKYRRAKGYTQAKLAAAAQISVDSVWAIERQKSTPTLETLEQVRRVLDVSLLDLITARQPANDEIEKELDQLTEFLRVRTATDVQLVRELVERIFHRIEHGA
jgi:transcriptional regulator with XRE-family HTH domain